MPNRRHFDHIGNFNPKESRGPEASLEGDAAFPSSFADTPAEAEPQAWHELVILGDVAAARSDGDGPSTLLHVAMGDVTGDGFKVEIEGVTIDHLMRDDGDAPSAGFLMEIEH